MHLVTFSAGASGVPCLLKERGGPPVRTCSDHLWHHRTSSGVRFILTFGRMDNDCVTCLRGS